MKEILIICNQPYEPLSAIKRKGNIKKIKTIITDYEFHKEIKTSPIVDAIEIFEKAWRDTPLIDKHIGDFADRKRNILLTKGNRYVMFENGAGAWVFESKLLILEYAFSGSKEYGLIRKNVSRVSLVYDPEIKKWVVHL